MKKQLIIAFVALGMLACTEKNDPSQPVNPSKAEVISCEPTSMTINENTGGSFHVKVLTDSEWSVLVQEDKSWVSVEKRDGYVKVAVEPGETDKAIIFFASGDNIASFMIYRDSTHIEGSLPGRFSVSDNKDVYFSQGNLQYLASTDNWRFAKNQYNYIGDDNSNISSTNTEWIDLFGWGTGNNPTLTSTNADDYNTFEDWGINPISNGGNKANLWRTLTNEEWGYLFLTRPNAEELYGLGRVDGINGTIILPDNWWTPKGLSFSPGIIVDASDAKNVKKEHHFSDNTYTAEEWIVMEYYGAIFLPAAGSRRHTDIYFTNTAGYYWSDTPYDVLLAHNLHFCSEDIKPTPQWQYVRHCGLSVRLVHDDK